MKISGSTTWSGLIFAVCAGLHAAGGVLVADDESADELAKLRDAYEEAAYRALASLQQRHVKDLEAYVRRMTQAGNLDAALKGKRELEKFRKEAGLMENPFVGEWEYEYAGRTYRRIILESGAVELWREGKVWMSGEGKPIWDGHKWKSTGDSIELRNAKGQLTYVWRLDPKNPNKVIQRGASSSKTEIFRRAKEAWRD